MDGKPYGEDGFYCEQHGKIAPSFSWVLNLIMDDGSGNTRAICFKNQAVNLLKMTEEQILQFKEEPTKFDEIKNKLLGEQIKIQGRANKNEMFNRLEFVVRKVYTKPDPKEEIDRLTKEVDVVKEDAV